MIDLLTYYYVLRACNLQLATRYLLLATCNLQLATRYSVLLTCPRSGGACCLPLRSTSKQYYEVSLPRTAHYHSPTCYLLPRPLTTSSQLPPATSLHNVPARRAEPPHRSRRCAGWRPAAVRAEARRVAPRERRRPASRRRRSGGGTRPAAC